MFGDLLDLDYGIGGWGGVDPSIFQGLYDLDLTDLLSYQAPSTIMPPIPSSGFTLADLPATPSVSLPPSLRITPPVGGGAGTPLPMHYQASAGAGALPGVGQSTAPKPGFWEGAWDSTVSAAKQNPFAALALLGAGAATIGGLSQSGSGRVQLPQRGSQALTPQEQTLLDRGTAPLATDSTMQARHESMRRMLADRFRRQLGPGFEHSTPYLEAKKRLEETIASELTNRQQMDRGQALSGLGTLSGINTASQSMEFQAALMELQRQQQAQQQLYGLAGNLAGLGLWGMSRPPATARA